METTFARRPEVPLDPRPRKAVMAFAALLIPYLMLVRRYWFVCDDAFITFRYSRNWALGHGPRYNLGDEVPVEGYSNFLWMTLAAVVERVQADVTVVMPLLSVATGVLLLAMVYRTLLVHAKASLPVAWTSTLLLACFPPFVVWSTSGLATMPQSMLMYATWLLLAVEQDDRRAPVAAGVTGLLLALVRTEGIAWAVVLGGIALAHRRLAGRTLRPLLSYVGLVATGYAVYFAWRYGYYQSLVANTAYAKVHMQAETLMRGLSYIALYSATLLSPLALLIAIPVGLRGRSRLLAASAGLMAIAVPSYAVAVSGDYMTWFRILVPGAAFFATSVGIALAEVDTRPAGERWVAPALGALLVALGLMPAFDVFLVPDTTRSELQVREKLEAFRTENEQWEAMVEHSIAWREKGEALAAYARPGETYVAAAIGNLGYYSDLYIYDRNGLVTREVAMQPWSGELRSPGHDKTVEFEFFLPYEPDILDAKLLYGPGLEGKIRYSLREMRAFTVKETYFPDLFDLPKRPGARVKRLLLALRRADSPTEAEEGWRRFREALDRMGPGT